MKRSVFLILLIQLILSAIFVFFADNMRFNRDSLTGIGMVNLIFGVICGLIGLVISIFKDELGKSIMIASGLLLLLGFLTCSIFPMRWGN